LYHERNQRTKANTHHIDLREHDRVKCFFSNFSFGADAVIHLASFPRQKVVGQNPVWGSDVMSTGLVNLLELTKAYKVPKFVYISSSMVYGDFENNVTEDAPCNPIGQYGIMKYMGEKLVEDYSRKFGFDYTIIRPSAVYGELDVEDRVVSKFILAAMRNETLKVKGQNEVLDFTYVEDAAQGIVQATLSDAANNKIYNITRSADEEYTLLRAAQLAIEVAGGYGNIHPEGRDLSFPKRGRLDISRAVADFGYAPAVNVEEGFRRYHEWFKRSTYWRKLL
jgi:nucleoside-diphosphate-sugar epimerase